jgi:predicted transcriptional regulator
VPRRVPSGIPQEVESLIAEHIDSVEKLEILLFLRGEATQVWTVERLSRELRRNPNSVGRSLNQLLQRGLLAGSERDGYRFAPADARVAQQVDRLAETYATRRVSVVQLIVSNPMDSVTTFADAFRFKRKR